MKANFLTLRDEPEAPDNSIPYVPVEPEVAVLAIKERKWSVLDRNALERGTPRPAALEIP